MSSDIEKMVKTCTECIKCAVPQVELLLSSPMPTLPWQNVATDLFEWKGAVYLLIIDYFSRWIDISRMEQTTSTKVVVFLILDPSIAQHFFPQFANCTPVIPGGHSRRDIQTKLLSCGPTECLSFRGGKWG